MKNIKYTIYFVLMLVLSSACKKSDFLNAKPSSTIVIPTSLSDFQALLDNDANPGYMNETPELGEVSSDDYYLTTSYWQTLAFKEANGYVWAKDIYQGQGNITDWNIPYSQIFYSNVVLEGIDKLGISNSNQAQFNSIKGSALFYRAYAMYNLSQVFCPSYDKGSASTDLGIPLKLTSTVTTNIKRSSVQETYDQIVADLTASSKLLPQAIPFNNRNRPSRPAAFALLARMYLSMRIYDKASSYADSSLNLYSKLIDYNTVDTTSILPFDKLNIETIYQSHMVHDVNLFLPIVDPDCIVDSTLYKLYDKNDLRRTIFFSSGSSGNINRKIFYNQDLPPFTGLATDEIYLIRAECKARNGDLPGALDDLNTVLKTRWKVNTFTPITYSGSADLLSKIKLERRKELVFRGLRWSDLRRYNKEGDNIILKRNINGNIYQLQPNSPLYILPIPPDEITLSGIQQNIR